ncbi:MULTISPECIES: HAD family hydrolase [Nitrosomonas]|uniref:HAD family hydrolase n=1 Tax=Nitrosomonas TaxID=914 RepID=UPI0008967563|nr:MULTISPECIES: HAD family hydrolase [Nitrosomonas]MXS80751.1 HAD family hydrolase [Nitrosomonas sp. GH22]SDX09134.1 haloacid dehalogenase superfamily, subfamily IA, variant 3 with third motif having DD or ED [Nitrosomonas eutropha]SEJ29493.1 haloacid dehalogenase superfamily, subfamily IA, variant 3 with third motif having DD or ED [Nitrosomonas eutropha]
MALSAVLFDVDGTLADTERDGHRLAFNQAFNELQLDWQWDIDLYGVLLQITGGKERIRFYLENYVPSFLGRNDLDEWITQIHKVKTRYFLNLLKEGRIPLRPGIKRLLDELRKNNIKIAIATTTTYENVSTLLQCTLGDDALSWFTVIGAGDIVPKKKPAPDIYHWVLGQLGLPAEDCIAIEDSENGLKSATAAGIKTIITTSEYTRQQDFNNAALVLEDLENVMIASHNEPLSVQTLINLNRRTPI